jgi:Fungal specific transcription factor domain
MANLPYFIKPLPPRIGSDEAAYLEKKGVLTVPTIPLRNELLKAYIEFVHPYMPLLDLYEFVMIIESGSGVLGRISLILYQAVMFAGSAFVDMHHLHNAGYLTRKEARKDFFQKTRVSGLKPQCVPLQTNESQLLYDFDYESDRVSLVQALLLLTYYYETPDDQKDTWHWMGVATSVAHTIGLHRNPDRSSMDAKRSKLWKRIWWSTYMRDRLIALGMRRPTRIKSEDYDVPMLTLDDFELVAIPESVSCIPADCLLARDVDKQRELAIMCIEKARLCLCISRVLSKQYCVLNNNQGMVNDRTTMMLLPKKGDPEACEVKACDEELQRWLDELPEEAKQPDTFTGDPSIDLNRSLLHMVFFTTLSALHRPQVLPSAPSAAPPTMTGCDLLEFSRRNVRRAASAITSIAQSLDAANLVKYLPTTGVTVLLPAIIIHLLDIKAPDEPTRRSSLRGFCQCMQVMGKLRDLYAAADYSTAFLEAAIRKAGIHIAPFASEMTGSHPHLSKPQPVTTVNDLVDAGRRLDLASMPPPNVARTLTPPPEHDTTISDETAAPTVSSVSDDEVARRLETFLASTPPESDHSSDQTDSSASVIGTLDHGTDAGDTHCDMDFKGMGDLNNFNNPLVPEFEQDDFDALLNMDAVGGEMFSFNDGAMHGFTIDMDWLAHGGARDAIAR